MDKKVNYPDSRKPAEKVCCPICGKLFASRGIKAHFRMGHYNEIEQFYDFLLRMYQTHGKSSNTDAVVETKVKKEPQSNPIDKTEVLLKQLLALLSDKNFQVNNIPANLKETMKQYGWQSSQTTSTAPSRKQFFVDIRPFISESDPPKLVVLQSQGIKDVSFTSYEEVLKLKDMVEKEVERFKERIRRYKENPTLRMIDPALR